MKEVTTWKKLANFGAVVPGYCDDITTMQFLLKLRHLSKDA